MYYWPRKMIDSKDCYECRVHCSVSNRHANGHLGKYLTRNKSDLSVMEGKANVNLHQ